MWDKMQAGKKGQKLSHYGADVTKIVTRKGKVCQTAQSGTTYEDYVRGDPEVIHQGSGGQGLGRGNAIPLGCG